MVAFRVADDSVGTSEHRWLDAFGRRDIVSLDIPDGVQTAVVVSAHPDDDVLAVGDLLRALYARGVSIRPVVVTDGERSAPEAAFGSAGALGRLRRVELRRAYERLGIDASFTWLALPDGDVARNETELGSRLRPMIPADAIVLVPWSLDGHPDHDATGRAAARAAATEGATLWEFPIWVWHWADPEGAFPWERLRWWSCADVARKRSAIACFETQIAACGLSGSTARFCRRMCSSASTARSRSCSRELGWRPVPRGPAAAQLLRGGVGGRSRSVGVPDSVV